jgi:hypothetical protein
MSDSFRFPHACAALAASPAGADVVFLVSANICIEASRSRELFADVCDVASVVAVPELSAVIPPHTRCTFARWFGDGCCLV